MAPELKSIASANDVLPAPECDKKTTLRIFSGSK
jgi:hypothetical protein